FDLRLFDFDRHIGGSILRMIGSVARSIGCEPMSLCLALFPPRRVFRPVASKIEDRTTPRSVGCPTARRGAGCLRRVAQDAYGGTPDDRLWLLELTGTSRSRRGYSPLHIFAAGHFTSALADQRAISACTKVANFAGV